MQSTVDRLKLYPDIDAYNTGMLKVSDIHTIYYEQSGNPMGKPIVVVHGGPGGGTSPSLRCFFDPQAYRIIMFDQRGCGHSTPHACLDDNTTWHLVSDMELLRNHLGVAKWQVFGGSWGSTLALAYAITNPAHTASLILRGIFLLRKKEINWFYQSGASFLFPDAWDKYLEPIPAEEHVDLVTAYHTRLTSPDHDVQIRAAKAWSIWEGSTSKLFLDPQFVQKFGGDAFALAFARIESHYFFNHGFFETDNWILDNVDKIRSIPCVIVQGRYDVVCPMTSAWDLKRAYPEATLHIVPDAGHSAQEPGIISELISATNKFRDLEY